MADLVELYWRDGAGRLAEVTVDLDVAAAIERSDRPVVIGRGVSRTPRWQLAAAVALTKDRLAEVERERAKLVERLDRDWLRRAGVDPHA